MLFLLGCPKWSHCTFLLWLCIGLHVILMRRRLSSLENGWNVLQSQLVLLIGWDPHPPFVVVPLSILVFPKMPLPMVQKSLYACHWCIVLMHHCVGWWKGLLDFLSQMGFDLLIGSVLHSISVSDHEFHLSLGETCCSSCDQGYLMLWAIS